jgi:hypothetical protein
MACKTYHQPTPRYAPNLPLFPDLRRILWRRHVVRAVRRSIRHGWWCGGVAVHATEQHRRGSGTGAAAGDRLLPGELSPVTVSCPANIGSLNSDPFIGKPIAKAPTACRGATNDVEI